MLGEEKVTKKIYVLLAVIKQNLQQLQKLSQMKMLDMNSGSLWNTRSSVDSDVMQDSWYCEYTQHITGDLGPWVTAADPQLWWTSWVRFTSDTWWREYQEAWSPLSSSILSTCWRWGSQWTMVVRAGPSTPPSGAPCPPSSTRRGCGDCIVESLLTWSQLAAPGDHTFYSIRWGLVHHRKHRCIFLRKKKWRK